MEFNVKNEEEENGRNDSTIKVLSSIQNVITNYS